VNGAQPLISVVVPTRGRPLYLQRCLTALAAMDYPPERFEVIVVDDSGGPDVERVAFASAIEPRVVRPRRTGPSGARNAGAEAARGEFVAFTDDDCEPSPQWLGALERALEANPGAAVGGVTRNGAAGDTAALASQIVVDSLHAHINRDRPRFFASSNVAFPGEPLAALGGFDERFRYAEDRELCDRWIRAGRRFVGAPGAVVMHMRTLTLQEFWRQHYGYGRGAWAFAHRRGAGERARESAGVLREIAARGHVVGARHRRGALAGYLALSQAATMAGFAREALAAAPGMLRR